MARRRRDWKPNAYYHVVMRGNNRQNIFANDVDMFHFMRSIGHAHSKYEFTIIAFCIMTNHYHLLLRSKDDLSKIMAFINRKYSDYYSKRYKHVGRIYQRRYFATMIEDPASLLIVSRYIHRNPIETKIPLVQQLQNYPFSSFLYYYYPHRETPSYLDTHTVVKYLPKSIPATGASYCQYCMNALEVGHGNDFPGPKLG